MAAPHRADERITRPDLRLALCLLMLLQASSPHAATAAWRVMPLSNGPNTLSLTTDPLPAQAFLAHRDNGNAHGFDVLTLYIQAPAREGTQPQWQLVPAFDERDAKRRGLPRGEYLTLNTVDGADCRLSDFRLFAPTTRADATLVLADREFGDSFASPAPVMFRFFKLRKSAEGFGRPRYHFEFDHERQAARPYCDVGEALLTELGVGPYQPAER